MYILDIGSAIRDSLRTLTLSIFEALLKLVDFLYGLFMDVAVWHSFVEEPGVQAIFTRIGLILGLFMVFRLTFSAIEYLINPDTMMDKEKGLGNIVKKVLIMVILLGSVRFLFDKAYDVQEILLDGSDNILSKLVLGTQSKDTSEDGKELISTIFASFYQVDENACANSSASSECNAIMVEIIDDGIKKENNFNAAYVHLNEKDNSEKNKNYIINFDWLFSILTAGFIAYVLVVYTIQLGVRVFQLAYLEIIAPIPIMMYLAPKGEEKLKKWGQQCLTTFLDAFIRIAILYFIILIIGIISNSDVLDGGFSLGIVLILGLFMFAKKVPDLLGELFPSMGGKAGLGFGIKSPKGIWEEFKSTPGLNVGTSVIGWGAKQVKKPIDLHKQKRTDIRKERKQAKFDSRDFEKREKLGKSLHEKYGDSLPETAFSSSEYRSSYRNVSEAKAQTKITESNLERAHADFLAAYNSGDTAKIERATAAYDNAKKQDKAAQTRLEVAKQHHEHMKKIYAKDAQIEDAYKQYGDLHPNQSQPESSQSAPSMNIEEAATVINDSASSVEDQLSAAEALDNAARARNNSNNNQNNN